MERAVERGLERRQAEKLPALGVDEKAFRKGQKYFTLVNDLERSRVLYVAEDRTQASLDGFWETLTEEQVASIADDRNGAHAQTATGEHPDLPASPSHQRCQRIDQLQDPMGEVHRARIPEQEELPDGDLLPLRRSGYGTVMPLKSRKSLIS